MKKNELLSKVLDDLKSDNIRIQKRELEIIYNRIFSNIGNEISSGRPFSITNFGKFSTKLLNRRISLTSKITKKNWEIKFDPSDFLKKKINL